MIRDTQLPAEMNRYVDVLSLNLFFFNELNFKRLVEFSKFGSGL